ncbi:hypothetical protein TNCV_3803811 [Trichonephila clavipes]|nr:hypothetical protein TNCV_3803811 [Trichonephila clavipes]
MCQIEAHEIHHGEELDCTSVISRSLEPYVGDSMIWLVSSPILKELLGGGPEPPTTLPLPSTAKEDLRFDGYVELPHAT